MKLDACSVAIIHVFTCKDCRKVLKDHFIKESTSKAGSTKTKKKSAASRANGALGGRPRKHNAETKAKMREAWVKRKAREVEADSDDVRLGDYNLEEP